MHDTTRASFEIRASGAHGKFYGLVSRKKLDEEKEKPLKLNDFRGN
jgi:hypothetical protein